LIPSQAVTSVLCLLFRPKTVHWSTKNVYTSEITFLASVPWFRLCSNQISILFQNQFILISHVFSLLSALFPSIFSFCTSYSYVVLYFFSPCHFKILDFFLQFFMCFVLLILYTSIRLFFLNLWFFTPIIL